MSTTTTCPNCGHVHNSDEVTHVTLRKYHSLNGTYGDPITYKLGKALPKSSRGFERECLDADGYVIQHISYTLPLQINDRWVTRDYHHIAHNGSYGPPVMPGTIRGVNRFDHEQAIKESIAKTGDRIRQERAQQQRSKD